MIFGSISKHVKTQNWAAVVIDFLIVVIGVFIGIQVSNWNDERKSRQLETQYLERLFADLNGTIEDFNANFGWDRSRLETQHIVLESLRNGVLNEDQRDAFEAGLAWVGIHNPQRRRWGTIDELFSTGNISLIRDIELRSQMSALGAWYDRNDEIVRESMARIVPLRASITRKYQILRFNAESNQGAAEVQYDFDLLVRDTEFINSLSDLQASSFLIFQFSYGSMRRFEMLRDSLAGNLGIKSEGLPQLELLPDLPFTIPASQSP